MTRTEMTKRMRIWAEELEMFGRQSRALSLSLSLSVSLSPPPTRVHNYFLQFRLSDVPRAQELWLNVGRMLEWRDSDFLTSPYLT